MRSGEIDKVTKLIANERRGQLVDLGIGLTAAAILGLSLLHELPSYAVYLTLGVSVIQALEFIDKGNRINNLKKILPIKKSQSEVPK